MLDAYVIVVIDVFANHGRFRHVCERFVVADVVAVLRFRHGQRLPIGRGRREIVEKVEMFYAGAGYRCLE